MAKILLLLTVVSFPAIAFASGTNVGNGRVNCREGATDMIYEHGRSEGEMGRTLRYVCKRGQWISDMQQEKPVRPRGCTEGQVEYFPAPSDPTWSESPAHIAYVCKKGKFIPLVRR